MMDSYTGALTKLDPEDTRITNPPEGMVILHGAEDDIRRIATDVQRRHDADKAKAKRKAQKAARKRNR
jgi:hypothetical protein